MIDADEETRRLVADAFGKQYVIDVHGDVPDIAAKLDARPPAVALIDLGLTEADPFRLIAHCRQAAELRDSVPIAFTAAAGGAVYQKARQLGAADVIAKPLEPGDLRTRVEAALTRQRALREGRLKLGTLLVKAGVITQQQLDSALGRQHEKGGRLGAVLVALGFLTEQELADALAHQMNIGIVDLVHEAPSAAAIGLLPRDFIVRHRLLPLQIDEKGNLLLAMTNPLDVVAIDEVSLRTGRRVIPLICTESAFDETVSIFLSTRGKLTQTEDEENGESAFLALDESFIEAVDSLISDAAGMKASDIHIEPREDHVRVRCRIDGVLHELREYPPSMQAGIISRIKIMGNMDIAERRLPQDGRTTFETAGGEQVDLRLASIPSLHGENITIRLLEVSPVIPTLDQLGLRGESKRRYEEAARIPEGGIVISGPTGSGKSTTLYATLATINTSDRKIYTVEDPIERKIEGIVQTEIREIIGLTFARALRSLVRADPDVIMVGEIRDLETAKMAADAAVTGHLVFTTVHANDAPASLYRLVEMGLPRYVVAASFRCVVAQRLVRRLCRHCRRPETLDAERWRALGLGEPPAPEIKIYAPVGCGRCFGTGYLGRVGLYEVLPIDETVRDIITSGGTASDIRRMAAEAGIESVRQDGISKILDGTTSYLEVLRVTV